MESALMVFQVPAAKKSVKQNVFEFQLPGSDKTFSVPLLKHVKPSIVFDLDGGSDTPKAVKRIFAEYAPGAFELFENSEQLEAWMTAWQEASQVALGESSASADS